MLASQLANSGRALELRRPIISLLNHSVVTTNQATGTMPGGQSFSRTVTMFTLRPGVTPGTWLLERRSSTHTADTASVSIRASRWVAERFWVNRPSCRLSADGNLAPEHARCSTSDILELLLGADQIAIVRESDHVAYAIRLKSREEVGDGKAYSSPVDPAHPARQGTPSPVA